MEQHLRAIGAGGRLTGLHVEGLAVAWGEDLVLSDWSAELRFPDSGPGTRLPIVGRSGAGKSSLLYVLAGLKRPAAGRIVYQFAAADGAPLEIAIAAGESPRSWARTTRLLRRHCIGFMDQDTRLLPYLTLRENFELGPRSVNGWDDAHEASLYRLVPRLIPKFLEQNGRGGGGGPRPAPQALPVTMGCDPWNNAERRLRGFPTGVSGGERRRAALGPCLIERRRVLFADEPTASVDQPTRRDLLAAIADWQRETGCVFIWVTHDLHGLGDYADRVLEVGEDGSPRLTAPPAPGAPGGS
jgi:putative ABC transport system ATP-binding protein